MGLEVKIITTTITPTTYIKSAKMQSIGREELAFLIIRPEFKNVRTSLPLARMTSPIKTGLTASQTHILGISASRVPNDIGIVDGGLLNRVPSVTIIPIERITK